MQDGPLYQEFLKDFSSNLKNYPDLGFLDWKIMPSLKPGIDDGFDALRWKFDFKAVVGVRGNKKIDSSEYCDDLHSSLKEFSEKIGKWSVSNFGTSNPVPCSGFTQSITIEKIGHPLLEIPEEKKLDVSYSYSFQKRAGRKIVGVLQVKDADKTIEKVINNFLPLVDWLIVLENGSADSTKNIIKELIKSEEKIIYREIFNIESGGRYLDSLCGTDTVVVRVDSDEIWDPSKALFLREHLLDYDFSNVSKVVLKNSFLHVQSLDFDKKICFGKISDFGIHYFGNILYWHQSPERLHGSLKILKNSTGQTFLATGGECHFESVDVNTCLVLHFPFLKISSNPNIEYKREWDEHKKGYLAEEENQFCQNMDSFKVEETLRDILADQQ